MTSNFEPVGIRAVIQELSAYLAGAGRINAANAAIIRSTQQVEAASGKSAAAQIAAQNKLGAAQKASSAAQAAALGRIALGAAGAAVIIGGLSAKAAIDFESAFASVRKTVDGTDEQLKTLEGDIRQMARTMPESATAIAEVAAEAGQLGIQTPAVAGFTKVMIQLGATTNLSANQAADALARLANITGLPQDQFDRLGSTIVDLGNKSAATESEIIDFGLRIAGAGKIAGLTEANILAIGAAMASVGVESEAGGTAIQKVLLSMTQAVAQGGAELQTFADTAGVSAKEFQDLFAKDAAEAFTRFVEGLKRQGTQAFNTLDSLNLQDQRLIRAFLSLANAGDLLRTSIQTGDAAFKNNTALLSEYEKRAQTTAAQLVIMKNNVNDLAISLGNILLPSINKVTKALSGFFGALSNSISGNKGSLEEQRDALVKELADLQKIPGVGKTGGDFRAPNKEDAVRTQALTEKLKDLEVQIRKTAASAGVAGKADADRQAAEEAVAKAIQKTKDIVDALKDGLISFEEAKDLKISPVEAGAFEAVFQSLNAGKREAFEYSKTISKVTEAFRIGQGEGQRALLSTSRDSLSKTQSAASALFSRPTREVADLEVVLARVKLANERLRPAIQNSIDAFNKSADANEQGADAILASADKLTKELDDRLKQRKEADESASRAAQDKLKALDKQEQAQSRAGDAAQNRIEDQINSLQDQRDAQLDALNKRRDLLTNANDPKNTQRDALDTQIDATKERFDDQIKSLQDSLTNMNRSAKGVSNSFDDAREKINDEGEARDRASQDFQASIEKQKAAVEDEANDRAATLKRNAEQAKAAAAAEQAKLDQQAKEAEAIQHAIDLYTLQTDILVKEQQAADATLLSQAEQAKTAADLRLQTMIASASVRALAINTGEHLIPEVDEARRSFFALNQLLTGRPGAFAPSVDTAAVKAALLASALDTAARAVTNDIVSPSGTGGIFGSLKKWIADQVSTGNAGTSGNAGHSEGGVINRPQMIRVGEGGRPEVVLPLTKPQRSREILASLPAGLVQSITPQQSSGGGNTFNFSASGTSQEDLETTMIRAVKDYFRQERIRAVNQGSNLQRTLG